MKFKPFKCAPVILAVAVLMLICGLRLSDLDFFQRLENITYDFRARAALKFSAPVATNLAFVSISEDSIKSVQNGSVGFHFGLYWPREVYGRLVDELHNQHSKITAFDILFSDLRPDQDQLQVQMADNSFVTSDEFFATQLHRAGNAILGDTPDAPLPDLFATNALALGDITSEKDPDGVLRRVKAFRIYRRWHPLFQKAAEEFNLDLANAENKSGKIILPQTGTTNAVEVPVDAENNFMLANFIGGKLPPGVAPTAKAFVDERVWQIGLVLGAQELKLDLANAKIDLPHGKIIMQGANGIERTIPVDRDGYFYVNWRLQPNDAHLLQTPIENLLAQNFRRLNGDTNNFTDNFKNKLVIVGSTAQGNDLSDRGATPLARDTFLVSKHWNVANSIIENQFIRRASLPLELAMIVFLGAVTAFLTWQLRAFTASATIFALAAIYIAAAFLIFAKFQFWLPIVFPVAGAALMHLMLVAYRVVFEEGQKRHVKNVFSKIVAPEVVNELLQVEKLALGGGRREVTIYFADVRGFTEFTDQSQARVLEFIREHNLSCEAAQNAVNEEARETLNTVNIYLGALAEVVKRHNGTLDKYIGDCVMAFWGAPVPNENHAATCVRAAIDAQRAIYEINLKRVEENHKRELETTFMSEGDTPPKPKLPVLMIGSGINTGAVTVGLMGSSEHLLNYTVFGREVNLASRLEAVSGRSRIIISESTYEQLKRDDAKLAATCIALPELQKLKGFSVAVKVYEVPWRPANASPFDEELFGSGPTDGTSFTGIIQR